MRTAVGQALPANRSVQRTYGGWFPLPFSPQGRVQDVLAMPDKTSVQVHYTPDLFGFQMLNRSIEEFAGIPIVNLSACPAP